MFRNFKVVPIVGDGNCFFRALSYCLYENENKHRDIRLDLVNNIVTKWSEYQNFISGDLSYDPPINSRNDYERIMKTDGQFGGEVEMMSFLQLYPQYSFNIHDIGNNNIVHRGLGDITYDLLFSAMHYDVLIKSPKRKRKATLTGRRETTEKRKNRNAKNHNNDKRTTSTITSGKVNSILNVDPFSIGDLTEVCPTEKRKNRNAKNHNNDKRTTSGKVNPILDVDPFSIGDLTEVCPFCSALHFKGEKNSAKQYSLCCYNGKIKLPSFAILDEMEQLFTGKDEKSKNFRNNIRQYNNALSFVSFGAKLALPSNHGPFCFKIHGIIHHQISPLYVPNDFNCSYGQLFILDFAKANEIRISHPANHQLKDDVLDFLSQLLDKHNPYVRSYKNMHQKITEETALALKENRPQVSLEMRFYHEPSADPRRYNNPTTSEIAAVFETADGAPPSHRHITVYQQDGSLHNIDYDSMHCDPMSYTLIWPCGEPGWHIETPILGPRVTKIRKTVTMREFILYRIAVRGIGPLGDFNPIINAGKLTQQIFVDYYCRIEGDRLKFIRREQAKLRVETYVGLTDALQVRADKEKLKVGRIVILPSSFTGSPRNMMQNYQDAMALVRKFGKPDLFITFTCNAGWPEIKNSIHSWEVASNRPDIIVRVFHAKVKELLRLLNMQKIFGAVKAFLYTVEFQKRGLPHIHLLLTLEDDCKFRDPDDIDRVVSAEIPDPSNEVLYNLVKTHMMHGPCGTLNPSNVCMVDDKCQKKFPKDFIQETKENVNGYPLYKRRDNGITIEKCVGGKKIPMDNRDVVPYNPFLLLYFQAHINVEVCSSVRSVKYIHKYVYKGHDCCNLAVSEISKDDGKSKGTDTEKNELNHDEVAMFLNARYVSSTEAAYRLFAYPMHEQSHPVVRLPVHLPDAQNVYFQIDKAETALIQAELRSTPLVAWFKLNSNPVMKSPYTYPETPLHYTWNSADHSWHKRKNSSKTIGRMYIASPCDQERYHLRLLLLHVVGATGFQDLRTFNNVVYPTFKDAAVARGLTINDEEWHRCLDEASSFQMPSQLRDLFAYICVFQQPSNAYNLWNVFKHFLSEDFSLTQPPNIAHQLALRDIANTLKLHGYSLLSFNLPNIDDTLLPTVFSESELIPTTDLNAMLGNANDEQRAIIDDILSIVHKNNSRVSNAYFIDGPGGTGKTYVYHCLIHSCLKEGFSVISVAWTGIAAMLLPLGRTVHSRFKLPLNLHEQSVSSMNINSKEASVIRNARLIIWDEAPMANKHSLMCLNRLLKDIMDNDVPFGGKIIILGGDFRQVLPVVPHASRSTIVQNSIKFSPLWPLFKIFKLTINMRANDDAREFANFLLSVGNGEYPIAHSGEKTDLIDLPASIISKSDIIDEIYGDCKDNIFRLSKVAILAPKNSHCDIMNRQVLHLLPGEEKTYTSVNTLITEDKNELLQFPTEFLDSLEVSALPPHTLTLKEGSIVMLLRNLNAQKGLLNGTRLVVKKMYQNSLYLEIISGVYIGQRVLEYNGAG